MKKNTSSTRRQTLRTIGGIVLGMNAIGTAAADYHVTEIDESTDPEEWEPAAGLPTDASVTETTVISDLEIPWDLTFAGDDAYFTEREAGVHRLDTDALFTDQELTSADTDLILSPTELPEHENLNYGGFLGIAAHPDYPNPPAIYLYHSYEDDEPRNRVIQYDVEREEMTSLIDGIPGTGVHHGGRITFGPADNLWITTGDANQSELAQDPASLAGATLRITPDGNATPENLGFNADADPRTVTHGHRNPQGLAFAPDDEAVLADHGPEGRDEVTTVQPGANYGWPTARGGPDDSEYDSYNDHDEFTPPLVNTGPDTTWAPSGATFYTADAIDRWENRLFVCGLRSETLYAITLVRTTATDEPPLGENGVRYDEPWLDDRYTTTVHPLYVGKYGRLRHVEQGPNGSVFLLTSNRDGEATDPFPQADDDRIIRIDPDGSSGEFESLYQRRDHHYPPGLGRWRSIR